MDDAIKPFEIDTKEDLITALNKAVMNSLFNYSLKFERGRIVKVLLPPHLYQTIKRETVFNVRFGDFDTFKGIPVEMDASAEEIRYVVEGIPKIVLGETS